MARDVMGLIASAKAVIDIAYDAGGRKMFPLFSGGHDSLTACYLASLHGQFGGEVFHINTGIGATATRQFVEDVCREFGWKLNIFKSPSTYEKFVRTMGFPGPGCHQWVYARIKERCIRQMTKGLKANVLVSGCRQYESTRRMGTTKAFIIGERSQRSDKTYNKQRFWTAPCFDFTDEEQQLVMDHFDLPRNPMKATPIGMSGECFCGAFARPNEIAMIEKYAPDVAEEIEWLQMVAWVSGKPHVWGVRPKSQRGIVTAMTGPLCNSCDARAMAAGIQLKLES